MTLLQFNFDFFLVRTLVKNMSSREWNKIKFIFFATKSFYSKNKNKNRII